MNNCDVFNVLRIKLIIVVLLRIFIIVFFINYCVFNVVRIMVILRGEYKIKKNNNNNIEMV